VSVRGDGRLLRSTGRDEPGAMARGDSPSLLVRCFGGFRMRVNGRDLDGGRVRPRVYTLLRFLALHAGRPVHREHMLDALWPNLQHPAGIRNLQVAMSNLRALLEPDVPRGASRLIRREGASYLLAMPTDGISDVREFEAAIRAARRGCEAGRANAAIESLHVALAQYRGELLPEDGPAEWVVAERERYRHEAAAAAGTLAEIELARNRPGAAADAARRSLAIDSFRDASWQVLVEASQRAGHAADAELARREYHDMLRSLGLPHHTDELGLERFTAS